MKKILLFLTVLLISFNVHATVCTIPYGSELTGGVIYAGQWNANIAAIENCLNNQTLDGITNIAVGGIGTINIANSSVTDAKLFGITTAGKVNGSSIVGIGNVPPGAGTLPEINVAKLDSSGNGVDGGALISGLANISSNAGTVPITNLPLTSFNYGSSTSAYTTATNVKVVFGNITGLSTSGQTITNLPFSSVSTYSMTGSCINAVACSGIFTADCTSGSSCTVYGSATESYSWMAVGY